MIERCADNKKMKKKKYRNLEIYSILYHINILTIVHN